MRSTEIRHHIESGKRQLQALGLPVPSFDIEELRKLEAEEELEMSGPITKADVEAIKEHISEEFRKMFSQRSSHSQVAVRRAS